MFRRELYRAMGQVLEAINPSYSRADGIRAYRVLRPHQWAGRPAGNGRGDEARERDGHRVARV